MLWTGAQLGGVGGSDASQSAFVVPVCGFCYRESEGGGGGYFGGFILSAGSLKIFSMGANAPSLWRVSGFALYLQWPGCADLDVSLSLSLYVESCICLLALM